MIGVVLDTYSLLYIFVITITDSFTSRLVEFPVIESRVDRVIEGFLVSKAKYMHLDIGCIKFNP